MSKKPNSTPTKNSAGNKILFTNYVFNIFNPDLENWVLVAYYKQKLVVNQQIHHFAVDLQM